MNKNFMIYAVIVTVLTTGFAWKSLLASNTNDQYHSGTRGSGWSSFMGSGSWSGGSGGHK